MTNKYSEVSTMRHESAQAMRSCLCMQRVFSVFSSAGWIRDRPGKCCPHRVCAIERAVSLPAAFNSTSLVACTQLPCLVQGYPGQRYYGGNEFIDMSGKTSTLTTLLDVEISRLPHTVLFLC